MVMRASVGFYAPRSECYILPSASVNFILSRIVISCWMTILPTAMNFPASQADWLGPQVPRPSTLREPFVDYKIRRLGLYNGKHLDVPSHCSRCPCAMMPVYENPLA